MQFTHFGSDPPGSSWLAYVIIGLIVVVPIVVGLGLRLMDRRREHQTGGVEPPARARRPRSALPTRLQAAAFASSCALSLGSLIAGEKTLGFVFLLAACAMALDKYGLGRR